MLGHAQRVLLQQGAHAMRRATTSINKAHLEESIMSMVAMDGSASGGLVRRPIQRVLESLHRAEAFAATDAPASYTASYKLAGGRGTGKSVGLDMVKAWASERGWRVLALPSAATLATKAIHLQQAKAWTTAEGEPAEMYDSSDMAGLILGMVENAAWLRDLPLVAPLDATHLGEDTVLPAGDADLGKAFDLAHKYEAMAPSAVVMLRAALAADAHSAPSDAPPILVAIDDYNAFFDKSNFDDGGKSYVHAQQLSHCALFTHWGQNPEVIRPRHTIDFANAPLTRGAVVVADSGSVVPSKAHFDSAAYTAAHMRNKVNFAPYSTAELRAVLSAAAAAGAIDPSIMAQFDDVYDSIDLEDRGLVAADGSAKPPASDADLPDAYVEYVAAVTGGNAEKVNKAAVDFLG
ncbi:uncharacterized protein AMSG_02215 [Thecamonas trahens ATCC 50062]|uniref:Small ribosomal subunit protein mS29 n=1 Tax=Thecamonas trahens ATCC 50062 TaxID=461836 RepID=A0A0L0DVZ2_THETB|nr:hypothetical protein AMSG_02215 [Thecamonas trahens ATCC 50062]KNC56246.1 hypothetical protein AMSG_02215 [Thecamonas trahens ATCC 50062]|eukprot:XP_013760768.1 hypothetical protein AMSG_02215 [Thecamonas trahens ATCC 50062]